MGLFSRKDKHPKGQPTLSMNPSNSSINSRNSSLKSPDTVSSMAHMPKIDLPRPPDPELDPVGYLRSLNAVRERCLILTNKAARNELQHFDVDMTKFEDVVTFVSCIIKRDYDAPFNNIPPHGRHQHFGIGGRDRIAYLLSAFPDNVDKTEKCRRLLDLFLISVLLDAGSGTGWSYKSAENGRIYKRSEGLAIASLEMFKSGLFSSAQNKFQVDKEGLKALTVEQMAKGLQHGPSNQIAGLEGRTNVLIRLSTALDQFKDYFGADGRPGNMLDYLLAHPTTQASSTPIVLIPVLWELLMTGLTPIWPSSRTAMNGVSLGDAWPCNSMPQPPSSPGSPTFSPFPNSQGGNPAPWESILPFHKLTQWLTYSLMQPMHSLMKMQFAGTELLTGLPEYRNGGLFVDLGVLTLKKADNDRGLKHYAEFCTRTGTKGMEVAPMFNPDDDVIVEWRGVTVGFLDRLCLEVNESLKKELQGNELTLPQLLEAGSWKGGREMAEMSRPNTKEPPILIDSDGTVF